MNTTRFTVIATTVALVACSAAFATNGGASKAAAQVAYNEPDKFTDFRTSEYFRASDAEVLQNELTRAIERTAGHALPPGYTLNVRFTDIDLAGDINPFHRMNLNDVRVYKDIYMPRLTFDYAVLDAEGNTVLSGTEKLVDMAYDMRVRLPKVDYTQIESDLMRDFINDLGRKIAKGAA
jgi:hypothetical protein